MAEIKIFCLHCGQHIQCDEGCRGMQINCPSCNQSFLVPQARRPATPPPPPPPVAPIPKTSPRQKPDNLAEAKEWEGVVDVPEGWPTTKRGVQQLPSTPVLWNPMAAAYWSLLFSPAFGAFLHAQNADYLGRTKEAKTNRVWFYLSLAYLGLALASGFIFPTIPDSVFRFPALIFYCCWFYVGEKQVKYVKATWQKNYQRKSWAVPLSVAFGCWIVIIAVFVIASAVITDSSKSAQNQPSSPSASTPAPTPIQSDWNRTEIDAQKNGNMAFAVQKILANPSLRNQATIEDPQTVAKTPYNFYGQVIKFTGTVAVVQDYPAGSDNAIAGKESSDIVTVTSDQTIVESLCMKSSSDMRVGDTVNLYGYPAGVMDVPNRVGGSDVHLIIVGNDYDNLGAR